MNELESAMLADLLKISQGLGIGVVADADDGPLDACRWLLCTGPSTPRLGVRASGWQLSVYGGTRHIWCWYWWGSCSGIEVAVVMEGAKSMPA